MVESTDTSASLAQAFSVRARLQGEAPSLHPAITMQPASREKQQHAANASESLLASIIRDAGRELGRQYSVVGQAQASHEEIDEAVIGAAIDTVVKRRNESISDIKRAELIVQVKQDLRGWGILQPLIDDHSVTDIHCYDYKTVVIQRGKDNEVTGLQWPSQQSYTAFIDRLLLILDRSLSTQQHTIDVSLANGIRLCAIHESVCGTRGPYLCIRVPRIINADIATITQYEMAPPEIVQYLSALVQSAKVTIIIAGETGTGKTTLLRCLSTLFGSKEAIVAVEDTPEVNCTHPFYRCLVSRPANTEGVGEVTLQEHIQTTLRMTPTRVILGEMRSPYAAEAFLESAQTGHVGMSTIHARNAKETLVRLESLLGRAQKSVSVDIIRQQIALAVDVVVWLFREKGTGKPRIGEIIELAHYVEGAIQVRPMFTYQQVRGNPSWKINSWSSQFDDILQSLGVRLSTFPAEMQPQQIAAAAVHT